MEGSGNRFRVSFKVNRVAQVNDDQLFAGVEFLFQLIRGNARNAQIAQKTLASDKLIGDVRAKDAEQKHQKPAAKSGEMLRYALNLPAENVAEAEERAGPEERSRDVKKQEAARTHVKEYLHFISTAKGSVAEVQTQLEIAARLSYITPEQLQPILEQADALSRQLYALRNKLAERE